MKEEVVRSRGVSPKFEFLNFVRGEMKEIENPMIFPSRSGGRGAQLSSCWVSLEERNK